MKVGGGTEAREDARRVVPSILEAIEVERAPMLISKDQSVTLKLFMPALRSARTPGTCALLRTITIPLSIP